MKRIVAILLIVIYALPSLGAGLKNYYCCGKLHAIKISYASNVNCQCDKSGKKDRCCKIEYKSFRVNDTYFAPGNIKIPFRQFSVLPFFSQSYYSITFAYPESICSDKCNAPPIHPGVAIYLLNRVFRI